MSLGRVVLLHALQDIPEEGSIMDTFVLILVLCSPGAMASCSNGVVVTQIPMSSVQECEKAKRELAETYLYRSGTCVRKVGI
jgi:hypothetical protein